MMNRMDAYARAQAVVLDRPGDQSVQINGGHPEPMPDLGMFIVGTAIVTLSVVLLLAAAVTRRLHDGDRRGGWGLMPLPWLFAGLIGMDSIRSHCSVGVFALLFLNNLVYLGALTTLFVMLVARGKIGPNRYGDALPPPPRLRYPQRYAPHLGRAPGPWGGTPPPR